MIVHYPKTSEGKQELAERVAKIHACFVKEYIQQLPCPSEQKEKLMNEIIKNIKLRG